MVQTASQKEHFGNFEKMYFHPELNRGVPLSEVLQYFAWHGDHHIGHVRSTWKS